MSDVVKSDGSQDVQIGERTYRITRFKGLKAALAGALVSGVMREFPELQERVFEFRKRFRETNTIMITPAMAKLPRFAALGLTTEDFQAVGGNIEFPEEPDQGALLVHVFPDLFDVARRELQRFFGILVIPNRELEDADDADDVDDVLDKHGKQVMREGDVDELIELVLVGLAVFREQMSGKADRLGKLNLPWLQALLNRETEETEETEEEPQSNGHGQTSPTPEDENPSLSKSSAQPSSSDAADGDSVEETPSTEPLGANSSS